MGERVRNREILSPFLGPRVSERGKYVFSFFWRLFSLPFCLYFPPPHLSVFRTRMRRRRRFMGSVRSFSWVLASTPGTTGFRGLPERKREKERIYCYSRRVRRQRAVQLVHFSYFLCFAWAFRLDCGGGDRQYTWSSEQEDMWCWRILQKSFYCLPRPVVAKRQTQSSVGVGTRCDIPPALG